MNDDDPALPRLPAAYNLIAFESVGSTMTEARNLAQKGEDDAPDGTIIWAREQTDGRGRRGNTWDSPKGNFYTSLITRPDVPPARAAELAFVTGCAIFDTVGELCEPGFECRLKWPNDILLNDSKIGGMLLETRASAGENVDYVIIGFGINLLSHPNDTEFPATNFVNEGQIIPDTAFLEAFARHFMDWASRWVEEGFEPVRQGWKWRARGIGDEINVRLADQTMTGVFKDLAEDGSLILDQDGKERKITAGDVFFPNLNKDA